MLYRFFEGCLRPLQLALEWCARIEGEITNAGASGEDDDDDHDPSGEDVGVSSGLEKKVRWFEGEVERLVVSCVGQKTMPPEVLGFNMRRLKSLGEQISRLEVQLEMYLETAASRHSSSNGHVPEIENDTSHPDLQRYLQRLRDVSRFIEESLLGLSPEETSAPGDQVAEYETQLYTILEEISGLRDSDPKGKTAKDEQAFKQVTTKIEQLAKAISAYKLTLQGRQHAKYVMTAKPAAPPQPPPSQYSDFLHNPHAPGPEPDSSVDMALVAAVNHLEDLEDNVAALRDDFSKGIEVVFENIITQDMPTLPGSKGSIVGYMTKKQVKEARKTLKAQHDDMFEL
eukprot:TRINITY_DN7002_c0_g1_i6.p1 TRINITY_DN7002_c0_g1~~TRINITY_DN7002_c0_g1_i6.p1  ORF type:complete len:342 (+),score=84.65 TRINITY_DN7002_c0_g1_i6:179-1204(+)